MPHQVRLLAFGFLVVSACAPAAKPSGDSASEASATGDGDEGHETSDGTGSESEDGEETGPDTGMPRLDVGPDDGTTTGGGDACKVDPDALDPPIPCEDQAPADSFEAEAQWSWTGPGKDDGSWVTPLVANLTDDNEDGEIDLCDVPDVVVVGAGFLMEGHLYVLDGATGQLHFSIAQGVDWAGTPAVGDVDGDGRPEIAAMSGTSMFLFEDDGSVAWENAQVGKHTNSAIALADLDADGDVELVIGSTIVDHTGQIQVDGSGASFSATVLADLDGDGDQELVIPNRAYHHDGSLYYNLPAIHPFGYAQVADFDGDPEPEVLVLSWDGISMLEHDGTSKFENQRPSNHPAGDPWMRAATVHDFDGDMKAEFAVSTGTEYTVREANLDLLWAAPVDDASGDGCGTAFDFLGDGVAEAMYADEHDMFVFDGAGGVLMEVARESTTIIEYPTVADIDDDASAEILVSSTKGAPTIRAIRDVEDRWVPARRIWNQHTYHVTNVREDGTIPQHEPPHWQQLNTFRTQAQVDASGGTCQPDPEG